MSDLSLVINLGSSSLKAAPGGFHRGYALAQEPQCGCG